ncbi:MAG: hypothetical protein ABIH21_03905 [Patescibacteria group bacterium]
MKRIILFRFHKEPKVCANRLELLRKLNPNTHIVGFYGGLKCDEKKFKDLKFDSYYSIPIDDPNYKWMHADLCARMWYRDQGRKMKFDMAHIIEWDLILLESIEKLFDHIKSGVGLTDVRSMKQMEKIKWTWITGARKCEWDLLQKFAKEELKWKGHAKGGVFPASCMSRKFLERYSKVEVPSLCNDEVRLPLFAQCFKMKIYDTNVRDKKHFNCHKIEITPEHVYKHCSKSKVFHPVFKELNLKKLCLD